MGQRLERGLSPRPRPPDRAQWRAHLEQAASKRSELWRARRAEATGRRHGIAIISFPFRPSHGLPLCSAEAVIMSADKTAHAAAAGVRGSPHFRRPQLGAIPALTVSAAWCCCSWLDVTDRMGCRPGLPAADPALRPRTLFRLQDSSDQVDQAPFSFEAARR
jgi:hypothetical protein